MQWKGIWKEPVVVNCDEMFALEHATRAQKWSTGQKVNQSHNSPEVPKGFQEVKVPRLWDNGTGWW